MGQVREGGSLGFITSSVLYTIRKRVKPLNFVIVKFPRVMYQDLLASCKPGRENIRELLSVRLYFQQSKLPHGHKAEATSPEGTCNAHWQPSELLDGKLGPLTVF